MKVKVFSCGGTFEKVYNPLSGLLSFEKSAIPKIFERSRINISMDFESLFFKDSLDMDDNDRIMIARKLKAEPVQNLVLIHGTDTMVETAQAIKKVNLSENKVVVITGAMVPFSMKDSDAMFNFGSAFTATQILAPGIWICMNGKIFQHNKVKKNKLKGVFEAK